MILLVVSSTNLIIIKLTVIPIPTQLQQKVYLLLERFSTKRSLLVCTAKLSWITSCFLLIKRQAVRLAIRPNTVKRSKDKEGKVYHPDCLKCDECSASLQGKYSPLEETLICEKCLKDQVRGYHLMASK